MEIKIIAKIPNRLTLRGSPRDSIAEVLSKSTMISERVGEKASGISRGPGERS
jgi:hypothetical protein